MKIRKNTKMICVGVAFIAVNSIVQTQTTVAVISPELREKMRKEARAQAPECLEIKVLSVKTKEKQIFGDYPGRRSGGSETEVMIEAKVLNITRSKSGLKKGAVIAINYTNPSLRDFLNRDVAGAAFCNISRFWRMRGPISYTLKDT